MYIDSAARPRETAILVGGNELAEGLMLLRAITLKTIRLQLAIERHDRQVALRAADDLVTLDRRLQDCLEHVPATQEQLMFRRELDSERAVLNEEKLTLAAEILLRPTNRIQRAHPADEANLVEEVDQSGPLNPECELEGPRRSRWWLAVFLILIPALLAAAYFITVPDAAAWLAEIAGALR